MKSSASILDDEDVLCYVVTPNDEISMEGVIQNPSQPAINSPTNTFPIIPTLQIPTHSNTQATSETKTDSNSMNVETSSSNGITAPEKTQVNGNTTETPPTNNISANTTDQTNNSASNAKPGLSEGEFQIFVRSIAGNTLTLTVSNSTTILKV